MKFAFFLRLGSVSTSSSCFHHLCEVACTKSFLKSFNQELEKLYTTCDLYLALQLVNCFFPDRELSGDIFKGDYHLTILNISYCSLLSIQENTFNNSILRNLKELIILSTNFMVLEPQMFAGLQKIEMFRFETSIYEFGGNFQGKGFLKYMTDSLYVFEMKVYNLANPLQDPMNWLEGAELKISRVVFSGSHFGNILNNKTFSNLRSVKSLHLSNCSLTHLKADVFDTIVKTLTYLDLSYNRLITLPTEMLMSMSGITLDIRSNKWQCDCTNKEMLEIIKWNLADIKMENKDSTFCYGPMQEILLVDVWLSCFNATTTSAGNTADLTQKKTRIRS